MAVAQESEFLAVNQKIRVRIPAVTPFYHARDAEAVEAAACKPALTRCESGCALQISVYLPARGLGLRHASDVIPKRCPSSTTRPVIRSR